VAVRGVTLEAGSVVVLSIDGTLVFVESIEPTFAGVVALPEQPAGRSDERIFTPGRVGQKKISPYSSADQVIALKDLSDRNREFIANLKTLRTQHGPHYIERTPEESAAAAPDAKAARRAARAVRSIKAGPKYLQRCKQCNQQQGHPNHPGDHAFVPPDVEEAPAAAPTKRAAKAPAGEAIYTLAASYSLDVARAQPRGEKFNDGNRSFRVVKALERLPNRTGTIGEVIAALVTDGGKPMANPLKAARRALNQLVTPAFGAIVTRSGGPAPDSSVDDDGE
jgi:hypothetical protein